MLGTGLMIKMSKLLAQPGDLVVFNFFGRDDIGIVIKREKGRGMMLHKTMGCAVLSSSGETIWVPLSEIEVL